MKYIKKPIVIEAIQWTCSPTSLAEIEAAGLYFAAMDDGGPLRGEEDGA